MSIAVQILSTEHGRHTVTTIAADEAEARAAMAARLDGKQFFFGMDAGAVEYVAKALRIVDATRDKKQGDSPGKAADER